MAHSTEPGSGVDCELSVEQAKDIGTDFSFKRKIVWPNVIGFLVLNVLGFYGIILMFLGVANIRTIVFGELTFQLIVVIWGEFCCDLIVKPYFVKRLGCWLSAKSRRNYGCSSNVDS